MGARADLGKFTRGNQSAEFRNSSFGYFSVGFPVSEKHGIAVSAGLMPFSSVGYSLTGVEYLDTVEVNNNYSGHGGIQKVFAGTSLALGKNFSLGIQCNYLFGNLDETQARVYIDNKDLFSYAYEKSRHLGGFQFDMGVQYNGRIGKSLQHTVGATFQSGGSLSGDSRLLVRTFNSMGGFYIDTVEYYDGVKSEASLPLGFGFAYNIEKKDHWGLSLEMSQVNWSQFKNDGVKAGLKDAIQYSGGIYFQPSAGSNKNAAKGERMVNYIKSIRYTAGAYLNQSYVYVNPSVIKEFGTTFGVQLPVKKQMKLPGGEQITLVSRINLAAEYAVRGTTDNQLLQEDYLRIYLGFSLSDKWFIKRKYQ